MDNSKLFGNVGSRRAAIESLIYVVACAAGVIVTIGTSASNVTSRDAFAWTSVFETLGAGLRSLSLSGTAGNVAAWAIYVLVSLLPLMLLVRGLRAKRPESGYGFFICYNLILIGISAWLFYFLYILVNPGLIPAPSGVPFNAQMNRSVLMQRAFFLLSLIIAAIVSRMMAGLSEGNMLKYLRGIIFFLGLLGLFAVFFIELRTAVLSGAAPADEFTTTSVFGAPRAGDLAFITGLNFIIRATPTLYLVFIIPILLSTLREMETDFFSEKSRVAIEIIAARAMTAVILTVVCTVISNAFGLLTAGIASNSNVGADVPASQLLIAFTLYFAARYMRRAGRINDENKQFV